MNLRKQNGITLIALVITIIVLLILAAVSITALTDEDKGVVTKAKQAALKTDEAAKKEDDDIKELMDYADSEDIIEPEDNTTKPENNGEENVTEPEENFETVDVLNAGEYVNYIDDDGNVIPCIVLFDNEYNETNNTDYGIQIITATCPTTATFGNGTSGRLYTQKTFEDIVKMWNEYPNSLCSIANEYLNTQIASYARPFGSSPECVAPSFELYQFSDKFSWAQTFGIKVLSDYEEVDLVQSNNLGIVSAGQKYWSFNLDDPTRSSSSDYTEVRFVIEYIYERSIPHSSGTFAYAELSSSGTYSYSSWADVTYGVRVIFKLLPDVKIISGEGTEASPYNISI